MAAASIYRERAQRMRKLALTVEDPEVSVMLSSAADDYERLAKEEEQKAVRAPL